MSLYRKTLPQLRDAPFLGDGGLETTLVFHERLPLPHFAAFPLLWDPQGITTLRRYFDAYAGIAQRYGMGLVLETPTWRANPDWGARLGLDPPSLADANRLAVELLLEVRRDWASSRTPIVISGNLGPRGDGYRPEARTSVAEARDYHAAQIECFAGTEADMIAAFTMNTVEEAAGIALAANAHRMPLALSFTLETDGRLPDGTSLAQAIARVDELSGEGPAYYMVNCAHPTHFAPVLDELGALAPRLKGIRANASRRSHAELDACSDLDAGDPREFGAQYAALRARFPALTVFGGCCGTDHRHVDAAAEALRVTCSGNVAGATRSPAASRAVASAAAPRVRAGRG